MRTRCEACGRRWGAEEPLGLKAESTVASCAMCEGLRSWHVSNGLFNKPMRAEYASAKPPDLESLREAREKLGHLDLGAVVYVRQETLDELKRLPPARADHITPMHALAHSFERIEVRVWDEKRLGPITDEELARINDLIERGVLKA